MTLLDLIEKMDLAESQKVRLIGIITRSCMTVSSFKMLNNQQLVELEFPLPAILELRCLIENGGASPFSPITTATPLSSSAKCNIVADERNTGSSSVVVTETVTELTTEELLEKTAHLNVESRAGLLQMNRVLVDEIVERLPKERNLWPDSGLKEKYAKIAVKAYPNLTSLDKSCPHALFYKPYFKIKSAGDKYQSYPQSGLIEENLKSRRAEKQRHEALKFQSKGLEMVPKRKKRSAPAEPQDVDLKELTAKFGGDNVDYGDTRKRTIVFRKSLLCSKGTINYDNYLYIIGLNVNIKAELNDEFKLWEPACVEDTFAHLFAPLVEKVMRYASDPPFEAIDAITALRLMKYPHAEFALRSLACLAPAKQATGVKNRRSMPEAVRECRENFVVDIPDLGNLEFLANQKEMGTILCSTMQTFVVGPKGVIKVDDVFEGVDTAFRLFFVLNKKYPERTSVLWSFLQMVAFKIPLARVPTQVDFLARKINNEPASPEPY